MREYVFHIQSPNQGEGCGFFIGNRFYTCAHVIKECDAPYIVVDSKRVLLDKPVIYRFDEAQPDGYDIAVFDIPQVDGPLLFAKEGPEVGETLDTISWRTFSKGTEFICCKSTVRPEVEGNYYYADTDVKLKEGSSGSPLVRDGKVYGMLCAGDPGTPLCAILSSVSIKKLLNK